MSIISEDSTERRSRALKQNAYQDMDHPLLRARRETDCENRMRAPLPACLRWHRKAEIAGATMQGHGTEVAYACDVNQAFHFCGSLNHTDKTDD